jgi:hypothetical protein
MIHFYKNKRRKNRYTPLNIYVFFYAKRKILSDEELLFDYGEEYRRKLNIHF